MTGRDAGIDTSLANVWKSWYSFRKGKRNSAAITEFEYYLERNLGQLHEDLQNGNYKHERYVYFTAHDTKPRKISVASVRDRVVHRMLYDYLTPIWDKTFIPDAWSCRRDKGLAGAIDRAESFMHKYPNAWVWRADIKKMFDSIDHDIMKQLLRRRVHDPKALWLLDDVIDSYTSKIIQPWSEGDRVGLPIGNLTSQIMSNIYLNEFDRFIVHELRPLAYLRYGDDWLCFTPDQQTATAIRDRALLQIGSLKLKVNKNVDFTTPTRKGVSYLGVNIWSTGHYLQPSVRARIASRLTKENATSYRSLVELHDKPKWLRNVDWLLADK